MTGSTARVICKPSLYGHKIVYCRNTTDNLFRDFIDTEHSKGDVNKMLLGSFVEEYDQDEGNDEDPFDSPSTGQFFNPPPAQPTFDDYVANMEARNGAVRANMDQIAQGVQFSEPPQPNHIQSFQVATR